MRLYWVAVAMTGLLACKTAKKAPEAAAPAQAAAQPAADEGPETAPEQGAGLPEDEPVTPVVEKTVEMEPVDKEWAPEAEKAIRMAAPEILAVTCHTQYCEGVLTAATEEDLETLAGRVQDREGLPATNPADIKLTDAVEGAGTYSLKVIVKYDR